MKGSLEESLARLTRLAGTDGGFFVLALHSFVEAYVGEDFPPIRHIESFPDLLWAYGDHLKANGCPVEGLKTITRIIKEHALTNQVRHTFANLDKEEVLAATHNFLTFCALCRLESKGFSALKANLDVWDQKQSPMETSAELKRMQFELFIAQRDNKKLLGQAEQWAAEKRRQAELEEEGRRLVSALEAERGRAEAGAARVDQLRGQINALSQQKRALSERLEGFKNLEAYVQHVNRFSLYTRTRRDYERSVMKLTGEQQEAVDSIRLGHDYLIKGGAGTGKTIVLLHALGKAKKAMVEELGVLGKKKSVLLTFTNTLVKYDRYLAEVLGAAGSDELIATADSFFLGKLRALSPRYQVDYGLADKLARANNTTGFLTDAELKTEIEDFLFANMTSRDDYVDSRIPRRGLRQPLSAAQRSTVWAIRDTLAAGMESTGTFTKNYSRMKLVLLLERPEGERLRDLDFAFVDESQDLAPADLKALKLMARRGVIMAGDAGQTIYGVGSPYKTAGIEIAGRTRILRVDFRNTCAILAVAEKYRALAPGEPEEAASRAFREGPLPELYTASSREEMSRLLVRKTRLFVDSFGYDPENITILAPAKTDISMLADRLKQEGLSSANIRDEEFSFRTEGTIRLSTLHSSKGLDFPVVLLYLPGLPAAGDYDEKASDTLLRNLLYVAMTRAMDSLNVFVMENPAEKPLRDLIKVFDGGGK
jgi:hypothetical protein